MSRPKELILGQVSSAKPAPGRSQALDHPGQEDGVKGGGPGLSAALAGAGPGQRSNLGVSHANARVTLDDLLLPGAFEAV